MQPGPSQLDTGATQFLVWAPNADSVELRLFRQNAYVPMTRDDEGYFSVVVDDIRPGDRYMCRLDGDKERPDPASRSQPEGVHGPSAVIDVNFDWQDDGYQQPTLQNSVLYELHLGTFTPEGTFDAVIPELPRLRELGVTTLDILPVAEFPGSRNWGYDGVNLFAAHHAYGGVDGLRRLVNAAHQHDLAVHLDVVYNHLGPEGNYLWDYGPYFTDRYTTPWGSALNFDGPDSDHVRGFFIENALYWLEVCHIDGFRLDATHAYFDLAPVTFFEQLVTSIHEWAAANNRRIYVVAENDRSDRRLLMPPEIGGTGLDGIWLDDLHHAIHFTLTGEADGYYEDFHAFDFLPKVLQVGFAYSGQYSRHRRRTHGTPSRDIPADRFVVCTQNHDQVGNRAMGDRLNALTDFDGLKLAAGLLMTSPYVPMLFMGQEYGEPAPFLYFVSHGDEQLLKAVGEGRRAEFAAFEWADQVPDPGDEKTFMRSKINPALRYEGHHAIIYALYKTLLDLRREWHALTNPAREATSVSADNEKRTIILDRRGINGNLRVLFNCNLDNACDLTLPEDGTNWAKLLDSQETQWQPDSGQGTVSPQTLTAGQTISLPPKTFVIYQED